MKTIVGVIGLSLLCAGPGAGLGHLIFAAHGDTTFASLLLGCVGAIIGALAGAAYEIVTALRPPLTPNP